MIEVNFLLDRDASARERASNGPQCGLTCRKLRCRRGLARRSGAFIFLAKQQFVRADTDHVATTQQGLFPHRPGIDMNALCAGRHFQNQAAIIMNKVNVMRADATASQHNLAFGAGARAQPAALKHHGGIGAAKQDDTDPLGPGQATDHIHLLRMTVCSSARR
ncbi:MAG: hypothetical protein L0H83_16035 [Salinisphaera sp.]|nr:hypothetical protein [Salinisphaera sp.]